MFVQTRDGILTQTHWEQRFIYCPMLFIWGTKPATQLVSLYIMKKNISERMRLLQNFLYYELDSPSGSIQVIKNLRIISISFNHTSWIWLANKDFMLYVSKNQHSIQNVLCSSFLFVMNKRVLTLVQKGFQKNTTCLVSILRNYSTAFLDYLQLGKPVKHIIRLSALQSQPYLPGRLSTILSSGYLPGHCSKYMIKSSTCVVNVLRYFHAIQEPDCGQP